MVKEVREILAECDILLTNNRIFVERMENVGVMSAEKAIAWGWTGPCLRAAAWPTTCVEIFPIRSMTSWIGRSLSVVAVIIWIATLVRMGRDEQSCRIIEQCVAKIPGGPISCDNKCVSLPDKKDTYGNIEGPMNHFKLIMYGHGIRVPEGEVYFPVEGGNGELGYYVVSHPDEHSKDGCNDRAWRVRCRPPCLPMVAGLPEIIND